MNSGGFARSMLRLLKRVTSLLHFVRLMADLLRSELFCSQWMTVCFKMKPWRSVNVHLCSWCRSDMYRWCHGRPQVDTLNVLFGWAFWESPPHVTTRQAQWPDISLLMIKFTWNKLIFIGELLVVLLHHALGKIISLQYEITHCDDEFSDLWVIHSLFLIFIAV